MWNNNKNFTISGPDQQSSGSALIKVSQSWNEWSLNKDASRKGVAGPRLCLGMQDKKKEKEAVQEMQDNNGKPFVQNIQFVLFGIS